MLKKIPDGMYFKSDNAIKRVVKETLINFLSKLEIKTAIEQKMYGKIRAFFSGAQATIKVNGVPVAYAQGVTYNVNADPIPIADSDSNS
jgi:hypothetical protein